MNNNWKNFTNFEQMARVSGANTNNKRKQLYNMVKNVPNKYKKALIDFMRHEKFSTLSRDAKNMQMIRFSSTLPYVNAYQTGKNMRGGGNGEVFNKPFNPDTSFPEFITRTNQKANVGYVINGNKKTNKIGISNRVIGNNATLKNLGYVYKYLGGRNDPHKYKTYPVSQLSQMNYKYNKNKMVVKNTSKPPSDDSSKIILGVGVIGVLGSIAAFFLLK